MQNLSESVYECTLAVEAHMICDLLARAGISARVDGEFLAGAGGELPLGSTIKVRVEPTRAAEARAVIDDWEKLQPPPDPNPAPARGSSWRSPLWFMAGLIVGGAVIFLALRSPVTREGVDYDGDGTTDETYIYAGQRVDTIEYDRNADGKVDARWVNDAYQVPKRFDRDDDFDGVFEWRGEMERGWVAQDVMDADENGRPELIAHYLHGVLRTIDVYHAEGRRVVVREHYENQRLTAREVDQDGDGVFERRVELDAHGEPITEGAAHGPG
jgi:hypothetical protein